MKAVQPIRDMELLYKCLDIAHEHDRKRKTGEVSWELLLVVGFNTSLRISDIRRFRVRDLRGQDYAEIKAQKTGKEAKILINPHARRDINRLLAGRSGDEYILQSKQRGPDHKPRPITRQRAYQIINEIAQGRYQGSYRLPYAAQDLRLSLLQDDTGRGEPAKDSVPFLPPGNAYLYWRDPGGDRREPYEIQPDEEAVTNEQGRYVFFCILRMGNTDGVL